MSSSLGMEIEHNKRNLTIHLDTYIREIMAEYKATVTMFLKPKQVQMQPWIMLEFEDCQESPDPVRQKFTDHLWPSFSSRRHGCAVVLHSQHPVGKVLCFRRSFALGGTAPCDGVSGGEPRLQAIVPAGRFRGSGWFRRLRLGKQHHT